MLVLLLVLLLAFFVVFVVFVLVDHEHAVELAVVVIVVRSRVEVPDVDYFILVVVDGDDSPDFGFFQGEELGY